MEAEIDAIMEQLQPPTTTIPGIDAVLGTVILDEIGDIRYFEHPSKPVAYTGIDTSVSQSGALESLQMHMSKHGSPYLRRALFMAAHNAVNSDSELGAFYEKKHSKGKHYAACKGTVFCKLCFIIYPILSENRLLLPKS